MTTAREARVDLAVTLNDLQAFNATTGTPTTVTISSLSTDARYASIVRWDSAWVLNATQLQQRRAQTNGTRPSDGTITVDPPWLQPSGGDRIEITGLFACYGGALSTEGSYDQIIRQSARYLWVLDRLALVSVAGQRAYDLSAYAYWLTDDRRLYRDAAHGLGPLIDPPLVAGYPPGDGGWRQPRLDVTRGVPTLYLHAPYETSGLPFSLMVKRQGDSYVNGTESTSGPQRDDDVVLPPVPELTTVGKWLAAQRLANRGHTGGPDWGALAEAWEAEARALEHFYDPLHPQTPPPPGAAPAPPAATPTSAAAS